MIKHHSKYSYHLIIITIYPVLFLYSQNIENVKLTDTLRSYLFLLIIGFVIYWVLIKINHNHNHNYILIALIVSSGLILLYLVIPFQNFILRMGFESFGRLRYLLPIFGIIFVIGLFLAIKHVKNFTNIAKTFNIFAISLLIMPVIQITLYSINIILPNINKEVPSIYEVESNLSHSDNTIQLHDVYFIVLDDHGRSDIIEKEYNFNNSHIITELTELGFYIAGCSNANYPSATWQSMSATLNMEYLDNEKYKTQLPLITLQEEKYNIKNNKVLEVFNYFGYNFVSFNTPYDFLNFTEANNYIEYLYIPGTKIKSLNNFESQLMNILPFGILSNKYISPEKQHFENIWNTLNELPKIPQRFSSPKFIYTHLMIPHFPYVFSSTGEYISNNQYDFTLKKYADQVEFIDSQIVIIAKQIIENSKTPPIIIFQGDHGHNSEDILNAYYLPGIDYSNNIYPSISPVNSFRLIFNLYFGMNYRLLPDEVYLDNLESDTEHKNQNIPYDFSKLEEELFCLY